MDKQKLAKNAAITLGFVGLAIAAPHLIPVLALASKDYFGEIFSALFSDKDTEDSLGKLGVNVLSGVFTELAASATEKLPGALSREHNLHLETALATAYLESLDALSLKIKEQGDEKLFKQSESVFPSLSARITRALKEENLDLLFPVQDKGPTQEVPTARAFANRLSAEDLTLSLADADKMKTMIVDDVEITLRRWLNEERAHRRGSLGIGQHVQLPEPLRSYLREELLPELPHRMGGIVRRDEFSKSWLAFQQAHLQAVLHSVKNIEGSHEALIQKIEEVARLNGLVDEIAIKLNDFLINARLPQDSLNELLAKYKDDLIALEGSLYRKIDEGTERLSLEGRESEQRISDQIQEVDSATQAGINNLTQQIQQLPSDFEEILHKAFNQFPQFNPENNPAVQEKIHFATIDLAVELLKEGKPKSARKRLEDLREKIASENTSVDLRFRLTANLASCALQLDDFKTAESEYEAAISLKPEHRAVLSYAALTAMLIGNTDRALEYAQRSRPAGERDPQITFTYLRVLHYLNRDDEIERLLREEDWIERNPLCALALGLIRLSQQNYVQAEAYFRTALSGEVDNPHLHRLLAQTIIQPIDQVNFNNPPLQLSEETLARMREAESHLTRAIEIFEQYENPSGLYEALLQRAYVRGLLGQSYASLADCDRLLTTYPNDAEALYQKGHTLLFSGKTDEALECFLRIEDENKRRTATLSIAIAHNRSERYANVIEVLAGDWCPAEQTRRQVIIADLLLTAYQHTGNNEGIEALISDLERERGNDPEALVVISHHKVRLGQKEEALALYKKALEHAAEGNQRARISIELADFHFDEGEWSAAAQLYKDTVDQSDNNPLTRRYLISLFNSGARRDALNLAQRLRGGGDAIPFVSEIEAHVLIAAGQLEDAVNLFTQLAQLEPRKFVHRLWIVEIQRRLKNHDEARRVLEGITYEEVKNSSHALIQVATLRQQLDLGGDLPFAYRARRISFGDKDVHHAYVQLFMDHTQRESGDLDVHGVAVDFAVHLKDAKGEKKTYVIVEQEEYDIQQGEIPPTDLRAVEMLGKHIGDKVVFNEGRVDEVQYEIVDIQSKYVFAFQQTIIRHTEWFGGSDAMMVMDVGDGDYSKFFRMIDLQQERQRETAELYRERRLPLAMLAWVKGRNLFETWGSLVQSEDARLFMTTGNPLELQRSIEALKTTHAVVVEMSALLTLCYLNLLDNLPKIFNRIVVAQMVLDKLEKWLSELERQSPHMTMWGERGQYFHQEITEDIIARRRNFLDKIKSFVDQHTEKLPAIKALDIPSDQLDQYEEALGVSAASLFVASELKLPLYMDDVGLTQIAAHQEWQVQGVSTLSILAMMKSRGLLSAIEHCDALKALILANYVIISVNSQHLWWMCKSEGKKATPSMQRILMLMLQGPDWEEGSVLQVASEFTYRMWLEISELEEKLQLLDFVTAGLISGRDCERVKTLLKGALSKIFALLPSALPILHA